MQRGADKTSECRARQGADICRRIFHLRQGIRVPTNCLILLRPSKPVVSRLRDRGVGRHAAVDLVKRCLSQEKYKFRVRQLDGAAKRVEIGKPAPRRVETLIHAAEQVPRFTVQE